MSSEQIWRTTMYFAFLDHLSNELELTFPGDQRQILLGQYLIHSKFDNLVNGCSPYLFGRHLGYLRERVYLPLSLVEPQLPLCLQ
jgi:hypothetical protein